MVIVFLSMVVIHYKEYIILSNINFFSLHFFLKKSQNYVGNSVKCGGITKIHGLT